MALRYAWRTLRRSPLYTTVALISLSLGLGFSGAVFVFAWPVVFQDLPVSHAAELLEVAAPAAGDRFSYPLFQDLRDRTPVFAALAARCAAPVDLRENNRTRRIHAEVVSGTWFETLGLGVALGRGLTRDDDRVAGGHSVAVLTYDFWRAQYGGSSEVLRKVILLNGHPMTVVGVAARGYRGFDLGERTDLLVPTMMQAAMIPAWDGVADRGRPWLQVVGRLRPGVTPAEAEARLDPFYRALSGLDRGSPNVITESPALRLIAASQGDSELRARLVPPLRRLCAWAVVVWVFVCANYAAQLVGRMAGRQREVAIRVALGATGRRALRHFAAEGAILAVVATGIGLLIAGWIAGGTLDLAADAADTGLSGSIDFSTAAFTLGLALFSTVLLAGIPALRMRITPLPLLLTQRPENAPPADSGTTWVKVAAAVEIAVAVALAAHAGALGRELKQRSRAGDIPANAAVFQIDPALEGYSVDRERRLAETLRERLGTIPGVQHVLLAPAAPAPGPLKADPRSPLVFVIYAKDDPRAVFPALYRTVAEVDGRLPVIGLHTARQLVNNALTPERIRFAVVAVLAGLAALLAAVAAYTLWMRVAARRRREFAIRLALGASRHGLRQAIAREVLLAGAVGAAAGTIVAVLTAAAV